MDLALQQAGPRMLHGAGTRAGASTPRYASTARPLLVPHSLASPWVTAGHVASSEWEWGDALALYDKRLAARRVEELGQLLPSTSHDYSNMVVSES